MSASVDSVTVSLNGPTEFQEQQKIVRNFGDIVNPWNHCTSFIWGCYTTKCSKFVLHLHDMLTKDI